METSQLEKIKSNIELVTGYSDGAKITYYANNLETLVLDYTKREELNAPLLNFIEDKLIKIAKCLSIENKSETKTSELNIDGINLDAIKSITRGSTSITLKDNADTGIGNISPDEVLKLSEYDYITLNRHRKVFR